MPANFLNPGAIEFYVKTRGNSQTFSYLGTCTTAPEIEIRKYHTDLFCDKGGERVPWQKTEQSEQHLLTCTLNRLNVETFNSIRTASTSPTVHKVRPGRMVLNVSDFELYVHNTLYNVAGVPIPPGMWIGRKYKSGTLLACQEGSESRLKTLTLMIECNPLYYKLTKEFVLYTEVPADLPPVTPE